MLRWLPDRSVYSTRSGIVTYEIAIFAALGWERRAVAGALADVAPLLETAFLELRELAGVEEAHERTEPVRPERQRRVSRASLVA